MSPVEYATLFILFLQGVFAWIASTIAGLLAQEHYPEWVNELIASGVVVLAAIIDTYVVGRLTGDLGVIIGTVCGIAVVLLNTTMKPLQRWTQFLQSNCCVVQNGKFKLFPDGITVENTPTIPLGQDIKPMILPPQTPPKTTLPPSIESDAK